MNQIRSFLMRLAGIFTKGRREREIADELDSHLAMHTDENLRAGMMPQQAHREAMRQLGGIEAAKEAYRDRSTLPFLEHTLQDLRFAVRQLMKYPGFSVTAISILALGIGASTAIFSAVNPILFEPLPYPQASRLMMIWDFGNAGTRLHVTFGTYREILERNHSFESLAVMRPWLPTITSSGQPERFQGQRVSASYFRLVGVTPALGRDFQDAEDHLNGPNVVILGDGLWRRRFGADESIVGKEVRLDDNIYTVAGVMPAGFENVVAPAAELWAPLQYDKALLPDSREWGHHLQMIGRLREGVGADQARNELNTIARSPIAEFSRPSHATLAAGLMVNPLRDELTRGVKPALLAVLGAVLLVLVIACVNVSNLLLARGAQRRGELAMRAALGAGRIRIVRQLLTESLLLAALGGVAGLVVAGFGVGALDGFIPAGLPRIQGLGVSQAAFTFALGTTAVIGILVGLIPALQVLRANPGDGLHEASSRTSSGHQLVRRTLVVTEVSLALMLLVGSGLLLRSLQKLFSIEPGFEPSHVLTMQVQTAGSRLEESAATNRFFEEALAAVRNVPGVKQAGFTSQMPLSGDLEDGYGVHFESSPTGKAEADNGGLRYAVTPGYVESMGIPLRSGRLIDAHDTANGPAVALISESLAKSKFPGQDPLGRRLKIGPANGPWYTIVGVVGNVKQTSLALSESDAVYMPSSQWLMFPDRVRWLTVRVQGDPSALVSQIKNAIWSTDKDQPIVRVSTMNDLLTISAQERHFALILFEAFALAALILAATGIYGVLSGGVTERTREIGVRVALGASQKNILGLILRQGLAMTALGIAIGAVGSAIGSQALTSLLFEISRMDPLTYLGVTALLLTVSAVACWVPAWRASRVDPSITLRAE